MNPMPSYPASDDGRSRRLPGFFEPSCSVPRHTTIDPRIYEILDHGVRVGALCAKLGRRLGLPRARVELIAEAAVNHDIGKLLLPSKLLFSVDLLSHAERSEVQRHAQWGAALIQIMAMVPVAGSRIYENVCRYHHERFDGSGYPSGMAGAMIPLEARIVALADVFDALTSSRSYKQPWSISDASVFICAASGTQFDPRVVAAFQALYEAGELGAPIAPGSRMLTRARHLFLKAAALVQCGVQGAVRDARPDRDVDALFPERVAFASYVDSAVMHIARAERAARLTASRRHTS